MSKLYEVPNFNLRNCEQNKVNIKNIYIFNFVLQMIYSMILSQFRCHWALEKTAVICMCVCYN